MTYEIVARTHVNRRDENQDAFSALVLTPDKCGPFASLCVADGITRGGAGKWYSRTAVTIFQRNIAEMLASEAFEEANDSILGAELDKYMKDCIVRLNEELLRKAKSECVPKGGTTFSAAVVFGEKVISANVGDSPICMLQNGILKDIYLSDSCGEILYRLGRISRDSQEYMERINILDAYVGTPNLTEQHNFTSCLGKSDMLVMASDGAFGNLGIDEVTKSISSGRFNDGRLLTLFERSLRSGCDDNQTAILCRLGGRKGLFAGK